MSFEIAHESVEDSAPVYLYDFIVGSTHYRYTSGARTYSVGGLDYEPYPGIAHTAINNSSEDAKNSCTVTVGYDHPLSGWLRSYIPTQTITLTIKSYEIGESPTVFEFQGAYMKYVSRFPEFKMTFSPLDYTINQSALQKSYALNCQHSQYDQFCGLIATPFTLSATIATYTASTNIVDLTPTSLNGVATDYYVGGFIEIDGIYGKDKAWIVAQTEFTVEVDRQMPSLENGAAIDLIPSCKGSFSSCKDPALFNNKLRYLGAPHADKVNPFDGSGVKSEV